LAIHSHKRAWLCAIGTTRHDPAVSIERLTSLDEVFTRAEAVARGLTGRALAHLVRTSQITRIGNGVYRKGGKLPLPDPLATSRALKASISHESAAAWCGAALRFAPTELHLTTPRSRGRRADAVDGVRLHRADVPSVLVRGALVTTPAQTILDVARTRSTEAVAIGDSLCRARLVEPAEVQAAAAALPKGPGRPAGIRVASLLDGRAESVFESVARANLALAGLPSPEPQLDIYARDGAWIARVDLAWPNERVILECDGYKFHSTRAAFQVDRWRWTNLTRAGWKVGVVTWHDAHNIEYLVTVVTDLLSQAA
jgi:hypothetical protein